MLQYSHAVGFPQAFTFCSHFLQIVLVLPLDACWNSERQYVHFTTGKAPRHSYTPINCEIFRPYRATVAPQPQFQKSCSFKIMVVVRSSWRWDRKFHRENTSSCTLTLHSCWPGESSSKGQRAKQREQANKGGALMFFY